MPINRCSINGVQGWRWGSGKCYTGPDAKKKALRQAAAAYAHGYRSGKDYTTDEIAEMIYLIKEILLTEGTI